MEKTEKFRMRRYSKKTATNIYAALINKYTWSVSVGADLELLSGKTLP